ncbi:hypothetical protein RTBOTA2_004672 [Rhodotorula toruloides]|uniref:Uncharacterized protein n=1 Tax=Rhodotorula toruloides TaxID=5286 RepID=A0A0K3CR15_RHOTO|nr:hypothetical protein RTBOTA2_004672 [Rhodotorula toruloides]
MVHSGNHVKHLRPLDVQFHDSHSRLCHTKDRPGPKSLDQVNHGSCRLSPEAMLDYAGNLVKPPKGAGKKAKAEEEARARLKQASLELVRKSESPSPGPDSTPPSPKKARNHRTLFKSPSPIQLDAKDCIKVKKEELE